MPVDKMAVYNRLPVFAQNLACSLEGMRIQRSRYGRGFWKALNAYEARTDWSSDRLASFRDQRLRGMVDYCYQNVPYYHDVFSEGGIDPLSIKTLDDLKRLPILTKKMVNKDPSRFLSTAYKGRRIKHHTSGTTGSGFVFYVTPESLDEQWACWWRFRRGLGIRFGLDQATFGTQKVVPVGQRTAPFWRENKPGNQTYYSAFHESEENLVDYCLDIQRKRIPWIHGYPSLLAPLASCALEHGLRFPEMQFVTTGAENLYNHQADLLERAFGCRPYQHYGMCEGIANFSEDLDHRMFVDEDYAAVEFIADEDGRMHVIGSTLTNYAMPLLRWDVGDVAEVRTASDGRREVISIDGRSEDALILPDGTVVGKLDHVFKDTVHFSEAQIHQNADYSLTILAVKTVEDVSEDERLAIDQLRQSISPMLPVTFTYVNRVPRTRGGKLRFVVTDVNKGRSPR